MTGNDAWEDGLIRNLGELGGRNARERVLSGLGKLPKSPADQAVWVREVVARMDRELDPEIRAAALEPCGRICLGQDLIARARDLQGRSADLDALLTFLNEKHIGGGHLRRKESVIYAVYDRCYCDRVTRARDRISQTYCNCSRGWLGGLFESLLGRPVQVDLLSSIIAGDPVCEFAIRPSPR